MNGLVFAAMITISIYVVGMVVARRRSDGHGGWLDAVPESISQTVFVLPRKGQWLFTVVMWVVGFLLLPVLLEKVSESTQFVAFLMVAGILLVGASPLVLKEKNTIHYVGAVIAGVMSQLLVALNHPLLLLTWFLYVGYTLWAKDVSKNLFWVQVTCMLNVFALCFSCAGSASN